MSTLKKLLLSLMVLGAISTTIGAGTFASFTSSATNADNTFATGTIVLSNVKDSGTACVSTGGSGPVGEAGGTVTATNSSNCDIMFDASSGTSATHKRPGESATVVMTLKNLSTLGGALTVEGSENCVEVAAADQPYAGSSDSCTIVQLSVQDATNCYWGDNIGGPTTKPYITGAALSVSVGTPVVISSSSNQRFKITANGSVYDDVQVAAGTYTTLASLVGAINTALTSASVPVTATSGGLGGTSIKLEVNALNSPATSSNLSLAIPTNSKAATGLKALGFINGATAAAPGSCAVKTGDPDHTLPAFRSAPATALGTIAPGTSRAFTVRVQVPSVIANTMQGGKTNFGLTWKLTQQ